MRKIAVFVKSYVAHILLAALASAGSAIASVWIIDILKNLINESIGGDFSGIVVVIVKAIAVLILGMISALTVSFTTGYFGAGLLKNLRFSTMKHMVDMEPDYMEWHDFGDIVTRMTSELDGVAGYMEQYLKDWVYLPFMILVYSIYLFQSNMILAAASIAPLIVLVPMSIILMKPVKMAQRKYMIELGVTNNNIQEVCDGIQEIKAYNLEEYEEQKYYDALYKTFETSNRNDLRQYNMEPISVMIGKLPVYISLCLGGYLVFKNYISVGVMVAFVSLIRKFATPMRGVYGMVIKGQVAMLGVQRILELLDAPTEEEQFHKRQKKEIQAGEIVTFRQDRMQSDKIQTEEHLIKEYFEVRVVDAFCMEHVSFKYPGTEYQKMSLKDISLRIPTGKKTALVGRSGGGKSTILKLLYGHYSVGQGQLLFRGINICQVNPVELRNNISLISQDCYLFPMSIADNIRIGKTDATDEEIRQAAKLAYCDEFIDNMPNGYNSLVGEKGTTLSGGQRQRISIARAILKDADIILLDEPTSALDLASEEKVNVAIDWITRNKTVVVVAHRLTTIANADQIVVVDSGDIVEQGTHEELYAQRGLYYQLYIEYQSGKEDKFFPKRED